MKRRVWRRFMVAWLIMVAAAQQVMRAAIVVPGTLADVEGISNLAWVMQGVSTRVQTVVGFGR